MLVTVEEFILVMNLLIRKHTLHIKVKQMVTLILTALFGFQCQIIQGALGILHSPIRKKNRLKNISDNVLYEHHWVMQVSVIEILMIIQFEQRKSPGVHTSGFFSFKAHAGCQIFSGTPRYPNGRWRFIFLQSVRLVQQQIYLWD